MITRTFESLTFWLVTGAGGSHHLMVSAGDAAPVLVDGSWQLPASDAVAVLGIRGESLPVFLRGHRQEDAPVRLTMRPFDSDASHLSCRVYHDISTCWRVMQAGSTLPCQHCAGAFRNKTPLQP